MSLAITGTGTSFATSAGATVKPFKTASILDSSNVSQTVTITVTDINGGAPTESVGKFTSNLNAFSETAPGVYRVTSNTAIGATTALQSLSFIAPSTPGTARIKVDVTDNLNQTTSDSLTNVVAAVPPTSFIIADQTTGETRVSNGVGYSGPVAGLNTEYVVQVESPRISLDNLNISAVTPNVFIHTGSGNDAINVSGVGGRNVLDGSTGSNFLTGGSGVDTFFVDARNAPSDVWSTVVGANRGDDVTVFGVSPTNFAINWADNEGAAGARGLTMHATSIYAPTASFTLAGYTTADLASGKVFTSFGANGSEPYLNLHVN